MFLIRRDLGLSVTEWHDLPWWEASLLLEGLLEQTKSRDSSNDSKQDNEAKKTDISSLTQSELMESIGGFQFRQVG